MKQFAHEVYDGSHHFWYEKDLMKDHEYGKIFSTDKDSIKEIVSVIGKDFKEAENNSLMFWYFGSEAENTVLFVRIKDRETTVQINLKDFDFALNLDFVKEWKKELEDEIIKKTEQA